jgi:hypothetical protein
MRPNIQYAKSGNKFVIIEMRGNDVSKHKITIYFYIHVHLYNMHIQFTPKWKTTPYCNTTRTNSSSWANVIIIVGRVPFMLNTHAYVYWSEKNPTRTRPIYNLAVCLCSTCEAGTAYPSGNMIWPLVFSEVSCCSICNFLCNVL